MKLIVSIGVGFFVGLLALAGYVFYGFSQLAGGHKAIKAYEYPVTKHELEKAVDSVLKNSANVSRDTVNHHDDNFYNDGVRYVTINILGQALSFQYVIHYMGDSSGWHNSKTSVLSIAYANDHTPDNREIKGTPERKITGLFETEFLEKINNQLGQKYIVAH